MAKKKVIPEYSKVKKNGTEYYRTRILDADGKQVDIYGKTCEEVYDKAQVASRAVADAIFRKNNPTVREYCEKWLKMKSATVRPNTLEGYRKAMEKHIIEPIGDRYILLPQNTPKKGACCTQAPFPYQTNSICGISPFLFHKDYFPGNRWRQWRGSPLRYTGGWPRCPDPHSREAPP